MEELSRCTGFQWNGGNAEKNWEKHRVSRLECERLFFNEPLLVVQDAEHSQDESRYYALSQTNRDRKLFVVFTIRNDLIRVISARDMSVENGGITKMPKKKKSVPQFKSEDEEREFWSKNDSSDYVDWKKAQEIRFPNLKPSTKTISVRFPEILLDDLKILANKRDVPYQSLLKIFVAERVEEEIRGEHY